MRMQESLSPIERVLFMSLAVLFFSSSAFGQECTTTPTNLCFHDLTAPNIIGDSNLNGQPEDGPRAFTIAARVCNYTGGPVTDLFVNVGDGTTAGAFPIATVPGSATYLDENYKLDLMPGANGTRFEGTQTLADGDCIPFYFPVQYKVVDSNGDALWGKSNTTADDLPLDFSIWGSATDAGLMTVNAAQLDDTVTIRNQITANPNKIQPNPNGETWYSLEYPTVAATRAGIPWDPDFADAPPAGAVKLTDLPPPIAPGETITIYFRNPTFGNPNQGFDVATPVGPDTDFWFQPIGEAYWNPIAFRLVKVQAFHRGKGCNASGEAAGERFYYVDDIAGGFYMIRDGDFQTFLPGMEHMEHQSWYARALQLHSCNAWDAQWYSYTFIALDAGQSRMAPYQEVASGRDNEKYNGDYCGDLFSAGPDYDTPHLTCVPLTSVGAPDLDLAKTVDKTADVAGGALTYTIDFSNIGAVAIGTPTSGIQIVDQIPADTTFVALSATCSLGASCVVGFSIDNGLSYSSIEPAAALVTHLRWAVNQALAPAAMGAVGFMVVIDNPYGPGTGTVTNLAQLRIDNGPFLLMDDAMTTVGLGQIQVHLFFDTDGNAFQDPGEPDLAGVDVDISEFGGGMQTITSDANGDVFATLPVGSTDLAVVAATVPALYVLTTANDSQTGITAIAGMTVFGADIGYTVLAPLGVIGDFVWEDLNGDGVQDVVEPGIDGVTVELVSAGCTYTVDCPTTITAGGGLYSFTMLPADTYLVYVEESTIPGFPAPVRTTPDNPITIVLGPDEVINTADFGYETPVGGVIGDRVWADQNDDGVQDPGNGVRTEEAVFK